MANEKKAKRYTPEERKAYYIGVGAAIGKRGSKGIAAIVIDMPVLLAKSFYNGFEYQYHKKKFKRNNKGR